MTFSNIRAIVVGLSTLVLLSACGGAPLPEQTVSGGANLERSWLGGTNTPLPEDATETEPPGH